MIMYKIKQLKKLPKDCYCIQEYKLPFKFSGGILYIYEPGVNYLGDAVWYRWALNAKSSTGKTLKAYITLNN